MYHFKYVTRKEAEPFRKEIEEIIYNAQDILRGKFTFSYRFIGSSSRDMITYDPKTNKGFDFDVDLCINDAEECFTAKEVRVKLKKAFEMAAIGKFFESCRESSRVFTLKNMSLFPNEWKPYSCDFAIVRNRKEKRGRKHKEFIHFRKNTGEYQWNEQQRGYDLEERVEWLRKNKLWNEVRERYLDKKNNNIDLQKKSRALYAETINEIYNREKDKKQR